MERIAIDPEYTYNPRINFQQGDNDRVLTIPPGPNGPVGSVWIGLSKPTYGIHGTPEPSRIGRSYSNGCIRLTNWDARELAGLVEQGVTVEFVIEGGGPARRPPLLVQPVRARQLLARVKPGMPSSSSRTSMRSRSLWKTISSSPSSSRLLGRRTRIGSTGLLFTCSS